MCYSFFFLFVFVFNIYACMCVLIYRYILLNLTTKKNEHEISVMSSVDIFFKSSNITLPNFLARPRLDVNVK